MAHEAVAQPSGGTVLRGRPVFYCLILIGVMASGGCRETEPPPAPRPEPPPAPATAQEPAQSAPERPQIEINAQNLEDYVEQAAEKAYWTQAEHLSPPGGEEPTLKSIDITVTRPYPMPGKQAWLVEAVAEASYWKSTRNVVLVLVETSRGHETLLSYVGGDNCDGQGVSTEIIDLGAEEPAPALRVDDFAHGNQMSHTVMEIFRWDEDTREMASVLRAHISHMNGHGVFWDSEVEFHEGYRPLKHVVIESDIWGSERHVSDTPETMTVDRLWEEHRTSLFTWEGDTYDGQMNFPEKAREALARFGR